LPCLVSVWEELNENHRKFCLILSTGEPPEDLKWLVEVVPDAVDTPLCLDSPRPDALAKVLPLLRRPGLLSSVTAEPGKPEKVFPLAAAYKSGAVALTLDEKGIPKDAQARVEIASRLIEQGAKYEIREAGIYVDPLAVTLATDITGGGSQGLLASRDWPSRGFSGCFR